MEKEGEKGGEERKQMRRVLSDRNSKVLVDWDGTQFPKRLRPILTELLKGTGQNRPGLASYFPRTKGVSD